MPWTCSQVEDGLLEMEGTGSRVGKAWRLPGIILRYEYEVVSWC